MQHATWNAIESSSVAMSVYRSYRRLMPSSARAMLRWLAMPRWNAAAALVRHRAANTVLSGPFTGMHLSLTPVSSRNLLGYLLGTQEIELHDVVRRVIARDYSRIINVGAADGYYAIGFLRQMPRTKVTAFEGALEHHAGLLRAAVLNGVAARFTLKGFCHPDDLGAELVELPSTTLVLADIEGGELEMLDLIKVPRLSYADILVETHDAFVPNCTEKLKSRFSGTHNIELIVARPRALADFPAATIPELSKFMPRTAVELMNERRTGTQMWLYLTAKRLPEVEAVVVVEKSNSDRGSL
jgi:hypothetical protein